MIKRSELNRSLERELAAQEITLQKYREDRQRRDGKIAKQDKLLREYEKKMSEIGDTILELQSKAKLDTWKHRAGDRRGGKIKLKAAANIIQLDVREVSTEKLKERICAECAHVLIDTQNDLSRCRLRKHPIYGNLVSCDIERGFKPAEYAFVCGPEGLFWIPEGGRRKGIRRYQHRFMYPESKNKRHLKDRRKGKEVNPQLHERANYEPVDIKTSWATKNGGAE